MKNENATSTTIELEVPSFVTHVEGAALEAALSFFAFSCSMYFAFSSNLLLWKSSSSRITFDIFQRRSGRCVFAFLFWNFCWTIWKWFLSLWQPKRVYFGLNILSCINNCPWIYYISINFIYFFTLHRWPLPRPTFASKDVWSHRPIRFQQEQESPRPSFRSSQTRVQGHARPG